jgi:predicted HTH transcriptional regulator
MKAEEFKVLLNKSESASLDWKRDFPQELLGNRQDKNWETGKGTFLKDLVSIANRDSESLGFLVYGVQDEDGRRNVVGITERTSKPWDDAVFQEWVERSVFPPINFSFLKLQWEDKKIGIFRICLSPDYPHVVCKNIGGVIFKGQVYFRRGSKNTVALYSDLKEIFKGIEPFKLKAISGPVFDEIKQLYEDKGYELILPYLSGKDECLAREFKIAYYPDSRREIWAGYHNGEYEHIIMLRPKQT